MMKNSRHQHQNKRHLESAKNNYIVQVPNTQEINLKANLPRQKLNFRKCKENEARFFKLVKYHIK